jgi:hypothetical protein
MWYDHNTGQKVSTFFNNEGNIWNEIAYDDDNSFNIKGGNRLESGSSAASLLASDEVITSEFKFYDDFAGYVDKEGYVHYIGQIKAELVDGKIVITSDVYDTDGEKQITVNDSGNWAQLAGLLDTNTEFEDSRQDKTNIDYLGIVKGSATRTGSEDVKNVDYAALTNGKITLGIAGDTTNAKCTVEYSKDWTNEQILTEINKMWFDHNTGIQVSTYFDKDHDSDFNYELDNIAFNDDNHFNIDVGNELTKGTAESYLRNAGVIVDGYTFFGNYAGYIDAQGFVHYIGEVSAEINENNKVVITSDTYANGTITVHDDGNWDELVGLNAGSWAQRRTDIRTKTMSVSQKVQLLKLVQQI